MSEATDTTTRPAPVYVYITRPRCPWCEHDRLLAYRSRRESDGSTTRWSRCVKCKRTCIVVVE